MVLVCYGIIVEVCFILLIVEVVEVEMLVWLFGMECDCFDVFVVSNV